MIRSTNTLPDPCDRCDDTGLVTVTSALDRKPVVINCPDCCPARAA